jgi:hypothetical protein
MATNKQQLEADITHDDHLHHDNIEKISTIEDVKGHDFSVDTADLPKGYFRGATFIGSMFAIGVSFACGVGGFAFVAPILGIINADIGPGL